MSLIVYTRPTTNTQRITHTQNFILLCAYIYVPEVTSLLDGTNVLSTPGKGGGLVAAAFATTHGALHGTVHREELGFRLESIVPADDPQVAVVVSGGVRVQLRSDYDGEPGRLAVTVDGPDVPRDVRAPNGTHCCSQRAR